MARLRPAVRSPPAGSGSSTSMSGMAARAVTVTVTVTRVALEQPLAWRARGSGCSRGPEPGGEGGQRDQDGQRDHEQLRAGR